MKKLFQITGAVTAWFAVILQLYITMSLADSRLSEFIRYLSFMTIWTNIIVAVTYSSLLLNSERNLIGFFKTHSVQSAVLVYIVIVGIIYHLYLSHVWNPKGAQYIADFFLHTFVPLFYLLYWFLFSEKIRLSYLKPFRWLIYPLVYIIYILIKGVFTGAYPYPFINVSKLGYPMTFRNIVVIAGFYIIAGLILVTVNNIISAVKKKVD